MAEKKYDLLLGPRRDSSLRIKSQPWYHERLGTKYGKKLPLVASSWTFIEDGLDDFRDGKPQFISSPVVIKGNKGIKPSLFGSDSFDNIKRTQKVRKDLSKYEVVYSKCIPSQEKRKDKVDMVERNLLNHPLALYPHIEESLPHDLFEDIIHIFEPSLTLYDEEVSSSSFPPTHAHTKEEEKQENESPEEECVGYNKAMRNQRRHHKRLENAKEEDKEDRQRSRKSNQSTKIDSVTNEFCDWVRELGGDSNNIEEPTVKNLFASGYETKSTSSVPVHVVELSNVPPELRADVDLADKEEEHFYGKKKNNEQYVPSWVKVKYGAWYLHPNKWKARRGGEVLEDPKKREEKLISNPKKQNKQLDDVLPSLHGARAFCAFVDSKGARNPGFLENVPGILDGDKSYQHTSIGRRSAAASLN